MPKQPPVRPRYTLCPECGKRGLSHRPSDHVEFGVLVKCRYCKAERQLSSFDFWHGIGEKDPRVQAERAKQVQRLNDAIRDHMRITGARKVRLKRIGKTNEYKVEFD